MILAAAILWTLTAVVLGLGIWGVFVEPHRLEVAEITVPLPRLPEALRGLTIGHLSDLHLRGSRRVRAVAERACAETMARRPDLICFTGDVIDHAKHLPEGLAVLRRLSAPLGVYLVLGNHDCDATMEDFLYGNPNCDAAEAQWQAALDGCAVILLANGHHVVEARGCRLVVAGIGDLSAGHDDLPAALQGAPPADLRVLLCHTPDALDLPGAEWADLLLAGHTHGGQLQLPGLGSAWAPVWRLRHRASGLFRLGKTLAFVNRGVSSGFPARINCPPQVAILTLVPGAAEEVTETRRAYHPALEARSQL